MARKRPPEENNRHSEKADREEARAQLPRGKKQRKGSSLQQSFNKPVAAVTRDVVIGETITVGELANKMAVKGSQVIKTMMKMGAMATINRVIDQKPHNWLPRKWVTKLSCAVRTSWKKRS